MRATPIFDRTESDTLMMFGAHRVQREVERLKKEDGERQGGKVKENEKVLNMDVLSNKQNLLIKSVGQPSDVDISTQKLKCLLLNHFRP